MSRALAAAVAVAVAAAAATLAAAKPVLSARVLTPDPAPSRFPKSRVRSTKPLDPEIRSLPPYGPTPDSRPANADLLTPDSRALIRRAAVGATRTNAAAGTERTS